MTTTSKKGPGVFLAQFLSDKPPFDSFESTCRFMAKCGFTCVQLPSWDSRVIDLKTAAESKGYCEELVGKVVSWGLVDGVTELATHLQGQLMAVHPAYHKLFAGFAPEGVGASLASMYQWAEKQLGWAIQANKNLSQCRPAANPAIPSFTGSFLWPFIYPWPQRPNGLVGAAFKELARRWTPVFNKAEDFGQDIAFELHPGEDVHDGKTFTMFREAAGNHSRIRINYDPSHFILMSLDYIQFIRLYGEFISAYHVKDALFTKNGSCGIYGGFQPWGQRSGNFRSLGDGEVDFVTIESSLKACGKGLIPRVMEWECCVKGKNQGAQEGAKIIQALLTNQMIPRFNQVFPHNDVFDDFAGSGLTPDQVKDLLGF